MCVSLLRSAPEVLAGSPCVFSKGLPGVPIRPCFTCRAMHFRSMRVHSQIGGEATSAVRLKGVSGIGGVDKGAKSLNVLQIGARIVVGCFQNESCVFQFRVPGNAAQSVATDVALANVPMSIDA